MKEGAFMSNVIDKKRNLFQVGEKIDVITLGGHTVPGKVLSIDENGYDETYGHCYSIEVSRENGEKEIMTVAECLLCNWNCRIRPFVELHPSYLEMDED